MLWEWPTAFFRNFLPILEQSGEITAAERGGVSDGSGRSAAQTLTRSS